MNTQIPQNIKEFHIPNWNELPNLDLYLDQVVSLINSTFEPLIYKEENTQLLTKTMINNYVKNRLIEAPIKKKYSKTQVAKLFVICILKSVYSMNEIQKLIDIAVEDSTIELAYNQFCNLFEEILEKTFSQNNYYIIENNKNSKIYLLKTVLLSCSYKLYTEYEIYQTKKPEN